MKTKGREEVRGPSLTSVPNSGEESKPRVLSAELLPNHPLPYNHLHRSNIDMDFKGSLSKLKEKMKRPLVTSRSKRKPDTTEAGASGEGADRADSLLGSGPPVDVDGAENVKQVHPSLPAPPIPHDGEIGSM